MMATTLALIFQLSLYEAFYMKIRRERLESTEHIYHAYINNATVGV